jgi:hypothetical protein
VQWGPDAAHLRGGVILQGVSASQITVSDFIFA